MQFRFRRLTAITAAAALVSGLGAGVVAQAKTTKGKTAQSSRQAKHRRGPSNAELKTLADKLGVSVEKLRAALEAVRPAKPAGTPQDRGAGLAADLAEALNADAAKVKEILDANRPTQRPQPGTAPDHSALISALASGLGIDEGTVTAAFDKLEAAHRADEDARRAAFAAALAQELGLSTETVQSALQEVGPPHHPGRPGPPPAA